MTLPAGYRFRALREDDLDEVASMFNEEAHALTGEAVVPDDFTRVWWRQPDVVPEHDMVAVEAPDGRLAGAFLLRRLPPYTEIWGTGGVALAHHGRGIGAALVQEAERSARRTASAVLLRSATFDLPGPRALFEAHGFRFARRFLTMRVTFDGPPEPPADVPGVHVTGYDRDRDDDAVFEVMRTAFTDHWGESDWTRESWDATFHERDDEDTSLWLLAWAGETLAGALVGRVEPGRPEVGHISLLGVTAAYRRRGIGELLLRTAFRAFHARGLEGAELGVDEESETGANRLYERAGMTSRQPVAVFEKELGRDPTGTV